VAGRCPTLPGKSGNRSDDDDDDDDAARARQAKGGGDGDEAEQPTLLASLHMWETFGERALIKNEERYASVRVTSDELHVMCIGRDTLEQVRWP